MKLPIISLFAAVVMASCGTTRTSTNTSAAYGLPVIIRSDFEAQYPTATNVTWSKYDMTTTPIDWELTDWTPMDNNDYVVVFDMGSDKVNAYYDANGTWIGSAYTLTNNSLLPSAVSTTVSNNYSGYTIESVQREMWKDKTAYEIKLKNNDSRVKLLVDANGTILKQKDK